MASLSGPSARSTVAAVLAAASLLVAAAPASAAGPGGDAQVVVNGPVDVPRGAEVEDVVAFNGPVSVRGTVDGDVVAMNGPVAVAPGAQVTGDVVTLNDAASIASGARVGGDVLYAGERPGVAVGAQVGGDVERADWGDWGAPHRSWELFGFLGSWLAVSLAALAVGALFLWLSPRGAQAALQAALERPGASAGFGAALMVGLPAAAFLSIVTIVGIPLGVALLLALVPIYALGYATSAWVLGRLVLSDRRRPLVAFLAGLGALRLVALVPVLGGVVGLAATVVGLGALLIALGRGRGEGRVTTSASPAGA
jgi:hypothetical protein